ncbi:MAG: HAD family hydrolase [Myxococcota bacterium]
MTLPTPEQIQVLCLDLDDTILDNRSGMRSAWEAVARMLAGVHPALTPESVVEQLGRSTRWFWSDPTRVGWGRVDLPGARREIVGHVLASFSVSDAPLAEEAARTYTDLRHSSLKLQSGAHDLLDRFRRRLPRLALVTNGSAPVQREKIERFDLEPYFHHVQLEGEFGVGKPDPAVYQNVLRVFDASPEACLMVGDDYEADVLGALAVGMSAAWIDVAGRGRTPVEPPRPHATVRSLHELAERLGI